MSRTGANRGRRACASLSLASLLIAGCAGEEEAPLTPKTVREAVFLAIQDALNRDARDFQRERQRIAMRQTAEFVEQTMPTVKAFKTDLQLLGFSVAQVSPELAAGLWTEFGVYSGRTINHIASKTEQVIHGFDSFEGLPEDWRTGFAKGTFGRDGLPQVRDNVRLHKGWFDKSVPVWAAEHPGPLAFVHFDADLYSSTKTVLDLLGDRIVPGTILQFDEFFNYPGWQEGEYKAFLEFAQHNDVAYEYIGYVEGGFAEQVALRITAVGSAR